MSGLFSETTMSTHPHIIQITTNITFKLKLALAVILICLTTTGCSTIIRTDWREASECSELIKTGGQDKVIRDSKAIIRTDRWNADAYACLAMAWYIKGNTNYALKTINEAEETIPKETIDRIHDILWLYQPELLAEKEYGDFYTLNGGDCLLRNVTALKGEGFLLIGQFYSPTKKEQIRHIRGYKCAPISERCEEADLACPECNITDPEAVIIVTDYRVSEVINLSDERPILRNLRYIKRILELERARVR